MEISNDAISVTINRLIIMSHFKNEKIKKKIIYAILILFIIITIATLYQSIELYKNQRITSGLGERIDRLEELVIFIINILLIVIFFQNQQIIMIP